MSDPADRRLCIDRRPCSTCPYRRATPAGIWHPDEYSRLADWDRPMHEQPLGVFLCHHTTDVAAPQAKLCRGWVDVHGSDAIGVRLAIANERLDPEVLNEPPAEPVYSSGTEAALAGMSGVAQPSADARRAIRRLTARNQRIAAGRAPGSTAAHE